MVDFIGGYWFWSIEGGSINLSMRTLDLWDGHLLFMPAFVGIMLINILVLKSLGLLIYSWDCNIPATQATIQLKCIGLFCYNVVFICQLLL
jgi:hypothetical protein